MIRFMKAKKERIHLMTKKAKLQKRLENYNVIKRFRNNLGIVTWPLEINNHAKKKPTMLRHQKNIKKCQGTFNNILR